jgi:MoaA/NifB/PqqE/SkfB family radical SAM enzyme
MCNIWKNKPGHILPYEIQRAHAEALGRLGCYYYTVTGGEPTLVPDLVERLGYAASMIPYVRLVSNGLALTSDLARSLGKARIKEITISIDGWEDFHDVTRGIRGAFSKAWSALEAMRRHAPDVAVVVNSVFTPYSLPGLRVLLRNLRSIRGIHYKLVPLQFHEFYGNPELGDLDLPFERASQQEMESFLDEMMSDPRNVNSKIFLLAAKRYLRGEQDVLNQRRCLYSYHSIEIDSAGFVYPCLTGVGDGKGFAPDADLGEMLASKAYREKQRLLERCKRCERHIMLCYCEPRLNYPVLNFIKSKARELSSFRCR